VLVERINVSVQHCVHDPAQQQHDTTSYAFRNPL
jgi:hypothetical protein